MPNRRPIHPGTGLRDRVVPDLGRSTIPAGLHSRPQVLHRILAGTAGITPDMTMHPVRASGRYRPGRRRALDRAGSGPAGVLPRSPAHGLPDTVRTELNAYAT